MPKLNTKGLQKLPRLQPSLQSQFRLLHEQVTELRSRLHSGDLKREWLEGYHIIERGEEEGWAKVAEGELLVTLVTKDNSMRLVLTFEQARELATALLHNTIFSLRQNEADKLVREIVDGFVDHREREPLPPIESKKRNRSEKVPREKLDDESD
jgi:hypothetical protein